MRFLSDYSEKNRKGVYLHQGLIEKALLRSSSSPNSLAFSLLPLIKGVTNLENYYRNLVISLFWWGYSFVGVHWNICSLLLPLCNILIIGMYDNLYVATKFVNTWREEILVGRKIGEFGGFCSNQPN